MLTADERRLQLRRRRRLIVISLVALIVVVSGFWGGRPAMNSIKGWQARRHATKALGYIEEEKWREARKEATAAYQLRPTEPEALRAIARFLSRTKQVEALDFWKQLRTISAPLTREDLRDEAAAAIIAGEIPRADTAVKTLLEDKPGPADWLLAGQLSIHRGVPEDAHSWLEKISSDPKATDREQFQAAVLKLGSSTSPDQIRQAWARIEKLSRGQSLVALDALVVLARRELAEHPDTAGQPIPPDSSEPGRSNALDISKALESHPLAQAPQKLISLDLIEHSDPTRREALIARAIADWKESDIESQVALARWLNSKGEYQRELDTIPAEKAGQNRDLFLQRLDALGALGQWDTVKQVLDSDRFPLDPMIQKMYLARCNAQLGEKAAAENNWHRALEAAAGDPGKLVTLAEYAEKNGILDVAEKGFNAALASAPALRAAHQGRLRIAQASGDTQKVHTILSEMIRFWPNDPAVQNDEGYVRLLLMSNNPGDEARMTNDERSTLDGMEKLAAKLVEHDPASMPHRTFLALARLRQNRPQDALAVYANIRITPRALTASALAVHAAVLEAAGHQDDAKTEAQQIHIDNLLPEERRLIANLRL